VYQPDDVFLVAKAAAALLAAGLACARVDPRGPCFTVAASLLCCCLYT